jgi:hypothetical protein
MYGRADGMPSFQLTMAVRNRVANFTPRNQLSLGLMSTAGMPAEHELGKLPA